MRLQYHYFTTGLVLLLCSQAAVAIRHPLILRQDDTAPESSRSPATTNVESSSKPSAAASFRESSPTPTRSQIRSDASATSTPSSVTVTTSSQAHAAVTSGASQASASGNPDANVLPIQPTITPAMGLTGAILLLSGAVYAVIGIKTKWLYVFFSAAYLTGLAVTVLIIYLMNPPVSNAVQGGFFVAAFLTGVIFGAVSLVFPDITEGLGCLLGGFCLSMWFLTLKEDGLITSKTGRAIFIGCMSFAGFSLSFSHYTRTYGLIACISFAGSTITMLGIDCFSRAGWKEFWLYLWDLNDQTFPLNTNTYPLTRGIKVEVACVVLMSAMGIISQLKLWRVVQERREKNAAQRLQRDEDTKREEEELGRRIETDMSRERARWEAAYGNKNTQQDSVMEVSERSTPKTSTSIRYQERSLPSSTESVEMVSLPPTSSTGVQEISRSGSKNTQSGPTITVTVLPEEDEIQQIGHHGNVVRSQENPLLAGDDAPTNANASTRTSTDYGASGSSNLPRTTSTRSSLRSSLPPPPAIVPLPFQIPQEADEQNLDHDNASVSAVPESVHEPVSNHRPLSKRLSGGSMMKRFSAHRNSLDETENKSLIIPHIEDDRASSLAATLDEEDDNISLAEISVPNSPLRSGFGIGNAGERETHVDPAPKPNEESSKIDNAASGSARRSLTVSTDPQSKPHQASRASLNSPRQAYDAMTSVPEEEAERSPHSKSKSAAPSVNSHTESQVGLSEGALPKNMSKIAMSYRTNEWAKHLEVAEKPSLDDIVEPESPGVQVSHDFEERPAPVSDEIKGVRPKLEARKSKRTSAGSAAFRNLNVVRSSSNMSRNSLADAQQSQSRGKRSSSTPFPGRSFEAAGSRLSNTPSPIPNNTLMGQRETLVRNRVTSHSFSPQTSSSNIPADVDQENMTLAQRRQLIQQKPPSASQPWRQSSSPGEAKAQVYDSHQPRRLSGGIDTSRRETMLANWREGIRQSSSPGPKATSPIEDSRRMALVNEKRQKEMERQQKAAEKQQRESMLDNMMRSGGMQDAHREALRRMQAKANRSAS